MFFYIIILVHEKVAPKRYNFCRPRRSYVSSKEEEISGNGSELKVSVHAGLERLKVICSWLDGQRKRITVSRSHRDI